MGRRDLYEKRNRKIYALYREVDETGTPKYTREEIGERFGISGTRVGQIVREEETRLDK